jgi:predicted MFS family arabinose efflux permease
VFSLSALMAFPCVLILSFARAGGVIYVAYWILQTSSGLFWPSLIVWLTEGFSGKELSREISLYNRSWLTAKMLGPLVAGALYKWNSNVNFVVVDLCYLTVIFFLYMRRRTIQKLGIEEIPVLVRRSLSVNAAPEVSRDFAAKASHDSGAMNKKADLYLYRGWIGALCTAVFMGIFVNILPLHIRDGMGFSESTAGMVLFFRCAAGLAGFTLLARITAWHYNRPWFMVLQGGLIFTSFLFLIAGNSLLMYYAIAILFGLLHCAGSNSSQFYSGSGRNPKKNLAFHEIIGSIGNATGTAAGGFLYQRFRFTGVCLVLILFYGLGLWVFILLNKREAGLADSGLQNSL